MRVGVALSDPEGLLATPLTTLHRDPTGRTRPDLAALAALAEQRQALEVVLGLPRSLSGVEGPAAAAARAYAAELAVVLAAGKVQVPVRLVDERLSTVQADRMLRRSGVPGGNRARRTVIDQAAAVGILQAALDSERATGTPAGEAFGMTVSG